MSLQDDLRDQAQELPTGAHGRPRQADLRRAASAAYYSLFHRLLDEATLMMFGGRSDYRPCRRIISRDFSHHAMAETCKSFRGEQLPASVSAVLGRISIPPELRDLAAAFVKLQEERHRADYNLGLALSRSELMAPLSQLDNAVRGWQHIRTDGTARFFLMALPLWDQIRR